MIVLLNLCLEVIEVHKRPVYNLAILYLGLCCLGICLENTVENSSVALASIDTHNVEDTISLNIVVNEIGEDEREAELEEIKQSIADSLDIDIEYVNNILELSSNEIKYKDVTKDLYNTETTEKSINIFGANTVYQVNPNAVCNNSSITRATSYYLPDTLYSIVYDLKSLMTQRNFRDRGNASVYIDALYSSIRERLYFYEAVGVYTGESDADMDNLYLACEKIVNNKEANEDITFINESGQLEFKEEYKKIFEEYGIDNSNVLRHLAILMNKDKYLIEANNIDDLREYYLVPYRINYTSRENMMVAAMSLTGKVRYIWGGGHGGASYIKGINPLWKQFNALYPTEPDNIGFSTCIKPSGSWCPVHGELTDEFHGETLYNLDDYINLRNNIYDNVDMTSEKYRKLMEVVDFTDGVNEHVMDGLDCSGYASWIFNQITDKYQVTSTAANFIDLKAINEIPLGSEMLPGDVFAWREHIVVIVGKLSKNSKVYITSEQTPNVLKFGAIYYSGARQSDIDYAMQIASEANELIGGINSELEPPHCYNIDSVKLYKPTEDEETDTAESEDTTVEQEVIDETVENKTSDETLEAIAEDEVSEYKEFAFIGRFKDSFADENIILADYDKKIKDMYAVDIIQHTLSKLPISYITGYEKYNGVIFNKDLVASDLGVGIVK